jgi:hypothetical protein
MRKLLVLRHENAVLRLQIGRGPPQPADRRWLSALSGLIPRCLWGEVFAMTQRRYSPGTGGESTVQPVGRPLMAHSRRRAHDKHPSFIDLEARMITGIQQRLNILGSPRPGVFYQRDAHNLASRRYPV